jgi:hypothetical protein
MNQLGPRPILFSERLPTGVMVHFEEGVSVFFSARFLFEQREVQPNQIFLTDDGTFAHGGDRVFLIRSSIPNTEITTRVGFVASHRTCLPSRLA